MVLAAILAVSLVVVTFLFHYAILRWLSGGMARIAMTAGLRILVIVVMALAVLDLADARRIIEAWRIDYNSSRPHSALGYATPQEFAVAHQGHALVS